MSIRATAVATDTSDVVGTVDLACEEGGLALHFVRASAHAAEYVPAVPLRGQRALVPYDAITELWDDGETLRLSLAAPRVPYRRLVLAHFTRDFRGDHRALHRKRLKAQAVVAASVAGAMGLLVPLVRWMSAGPAVLVSVLGSLVAVGGGVLLAQEVGRNVMLGGAESTAERRAFFHDLRRRVTRASRQVQVFDDAAASLGPVAGQSLATRGASVGGASQDGERGALAEMLPTFGAVGIAGVVALIAVVSGRSLMGPPDEAAPGPSATQAGAIRADASQAPAPLAPVEEPLALCQCQGPSSPFIPARIPRLTVLPRVERLRNDPRRPSLALEVAVVNNGADDLREIKGNIAFLLPGARPGDAPRDNQDRGFYYEGPLRAGRAVKWRLAGRGTSYRVTTNIEDALDNGSLAPADAFVELQNAQTRSVRVHGAMMLARMRDERAGAAIERLKDGAREEEQPILQGLARAAAPVYTCEVEMAQEGEQAAFSACVMNTSDDESTPLDALVTVTDRAPRPELGQGPATLASGVLRRKLVIPPKTGLRVRGAVDISAASGRDVMTEVLVEPAR